MVLSQGLILGPLLFNMLINDGTECTSKFSDDTKLEGVVDTPQGCAALQRDLDIVQKCVNGNPIKPNKGKCRVPHLGRNDPRCGTFLLGR